MNPTDCAGCGACCRTFPIFASKADAEREPRIRTEALELPAHLADDLWAYKLHRIPFHDRCVFLTEQNRCTIYRARPAVCRDFAPGDAQCTEARDRQGLPPLPEATPSEG